SLYTTSLIIFFALIGLIIFKYNRDEKSKAATSYELQERKGSAGNSQEWASMKSTASSLQQSIKRNPEDEKSLLAMAALFIQEARITGNHVYYDKAAMKYINTVLNKDSSNFTALIYKSLIYLSQHHFADGLATAEKAQKKNPYNAFVYGIIVDGNVEMGNYAAAVENSDKMVSIRPDLRSYSRISYLREIYGDYPGAIEAMKMAVQAGAPGDEATEWTRVQLGHLYEYTGDLKFAEMHYTIALDERPNYAYALAGMARLAMAAKDYNKAVLYFLRADSLVNDYSFKEELVDVYSLMGRKEMADALSKQVIDGMSKDAQLGQADESIGHYADRELAYAYLKVRNYDKALEHALLEYNRRPENIDVNETVAWVYYQKGDYEKALSYIKTALKTHSKNPTLLCRAGLIYAKAGQKEGARTTLQEALKNNPNISESLKSESAGMLKEL
ncbi:MAG: tetratricopeptide repeat protein, partial [Chitinophagaceae bacterium]